MRTFLLLVALLTPQLQIEQPSTNTPTALAPDSPQLHLVTKTPPIYPVIARAAHASGAVRLRILIGPDGHIVYARALDGLALLQGAAKLSLTHWLYAPVLVDGKPVFATTTVTIPFDLQAPPSQYAQPTSGDLMDSKFDDRLRPLEKACTQSLASVASAPSKQIALCQKAADFADQFSEYDFEERSRTFTYLSTAFRNNKQYADALTAANKAVAAAQQGFVDGAEASAAYSVRAETEVRLGKLAEASEDLTIAEDEERKTIDNRLAPTKNKDFDKLNQSYTKSNYVPVLRALLIYHAQILTALGKPTEAAAKIAEADKL